MVLTPIFFILCILAGIIVGFVNIFLARRIVGKKLIILSEHMKKIEHKLENRSMNPEVYQCADNECTITVDSEDEIGECAKAFNALVISLANAFKSELAVRNFTEMLSSYLELEKLSQEALKLLSHHLDVQAGAIILEDAGELKLLSSFGINNPAALLESDHVWMVLKDQKRLIVPIPEDITLDGVLTGFRPKSVIVEPILYKDVMLGLVVLGASHSYENINYDETELFGRGLALAFRNAITHEQLQRLAARDSLTGIFNRRFGMSRLNEEYSRSVRNQLPLGLIIFDIDHFKKVNDSYGHLVGDRVLITLVNTTKDCLREGDIFIRYGGEEFLVIAPGASSVDLFQIAERIRHRIEDSVIVHHSQNIKVTVSLGGASFPDCQVDDIKALLDTADKKLYQAKESGRNMSVVAFYS